MYLKSIRIERSRASTVEREVIPFRWTAHHVIQIFTSLLPPKYNLDGSSLFQITLGSSGGKPIYSNLLGSSELYIEDFDFDLYNESSSLQQEQIILDLIEHTLLLISRKNDGDVETIKKTVELTKSTEFYQKTKIKKLCKKHSQCHLNIDIYRVLSKKHGESWSIEILNKNKLIHEKYMTEIPSYMDCREIFSKSQWQDSLFVVTDRTGRKTFEIDTSQFSSK
jgi:hypothetical protein